MALALKWVSESPRRLTNRLVGPHSRVPDPVSLGWDLRIRVSNIFPGGCWCCRTRTTLWEPLLCSLAITPWDIWLVINPSYAEYRNPKSCEYWMFFPEVWHNLLWQQIPTSTGVELLSLSLPLGVTLIVYCRNVNPLDYRGCPTPFWG